jgi:hypothetical protein
MPELFKARNAELLDGFPVLRGLLIKGVLLEAVYFLLGLFIWLHQEVEPPCPRQLAS